MARLRHLVVVVPGLGGSILDGPGPAAGGADGPGHDSRPGQGGGYALTAPGLARMLVSPDRLDVGRFPELTPSGLIRDFTALPPLLTLPGYQRLYLHLRNAFPDAVIDTYRPPAAVDGRADVLLVPYDFRLSVAVAAQRLAEAVEQALAHRNASGVDRPVIVLAHSLGGLVARYWIAVLGGWRHCAALLTLGTPHRGAPKALDFLVNGVGIGPVRDPRATRVFRGWPSMYELLPQYPAVWDARHRAAVELTALPAEMLAARPALAGYAPVFARMAAAAREVHERIHDGWAALDPAQAPAVVPYLTRGHATPNLITVDGGRLRISKEDPPWRGNVGWRGDGTVPALSAVPRELGDAVHLWRVMGQRHGPLGSIAAPVEVLRSYAGDRVPTRGLGPQDAPGLPDRPWLGLDLDDFALSGQPVEVGAALLPAGLAGGPAWVTVTRLDDGSGTTRSGTVGSGPGYRGRLAADEATAAGELRWRGTLPPLEAGRYEVAVQVMDVPRVESVAHPHTLMVLDAPGGADGIGDAW